MRQFYAAWLLVLTVMPSYDALSLEPEKYLKEGLVQLYNLEYAQARASFRKVVEVEPDNPFGYLFEAGAIWWQAANEYSLFQDTPTLQGLFEQDIEAAIRKADPLTDSRQKEIRADGHFIMGMALGTRGQWALLRGHWVKAYFDGKKGVKHLKKCLKNDPQYHDAYLGLGVYDYEAAHLGGILKLAGSLVGVRGDEQRGIERLKLAMEKGRYGSRQAAQFLSSIYIVDLRDAKLALPIIQKLRYDFPESLYFQFVELVLLHSLGARDGSLLLGRQIFQKARLDPNAFNRKLLSLVCGLGAGKCLEPSHAEASLAWFDYAISHAGVRPDKNWLSTARLLRAYAHDILGKKDQAAQDYRWVLKAPAFSDNRQRAWDCLSASCNAPALLNYLKTKSKS
ncbi:MAG: hypothetical protein A3J74_09080 [Elusimicrobia bacterium RIFCSPHIGHO2_02_FULL_57_9]|nr:MAG: hypothetical protein A3J74_09080 [Elusimicrobia bacterium RIFCSPHIGHO2_02_FULL_57_9]